MASAPVLVTSSLCTLRPTTLFAVNKLDDLISSASLIDRATPPLKYSNATLEKQHPISDNVIDGLVQQNYSVFSHYTSFHSSRVQVGPAFLP